MQDDSTAPDGLRMLQRIAEVLDMPVSDFYARPDAAANSAAPSAAESEVMLMAFLRVKDAEARNRIIALLRSSADH